MVVANVTSGTDIVEVKKREHHTKSLEVITTNKTESEELNMEAVARRLEPMAAVIKGRFTEDTLKFKPKQILTGDMRAKAETKSTLSLIDRELGNYKSLPELDFRAGYVAGRIYEKEQNGLITPGLKDELLSILYTKYQVIRSLESEV